MRKKAKKKLPSKIPRGPIKLKPSRTHRSKLAYNRKKEKIKLHWFDNGVPPKA